MICNLFLNDFEKNVHVCVCVFERERDETEQEGKVQTIGVFDKGYV